MCPAYGSGSCHGKVNINTGSTHFVCSPEGSGFAHVGRIFQMCTPHQKFAYLTDLLPFEQLNAPDAQQLFTCCASLAPIKRKPRPSSTPGQSSVARSSKSDDDDWLQPVQSSSPCPSSSASSSQVPQPFPELPPLDEPCWPHQPPTQARSSAMRPSSSKGTDASTAGSGPAAPALIFIEIICWLEDGQQPVHAIVPKSPTGEIVLQESKLIVGEAGIEKVGTFSCCDPSLHDWVPCPWAEPIPLKGRSVLQSDDC
ncbi:uncharacterized protein ARMOST_22116 [Armillaria ostoyae]|uniref:Uncharacterized protein n=1 Tax=Armillaria ostoyae TaxID=47428 RepID=A0A284SBY9_ARMOS|nr:uncharacterized protein ARMOST_22116 [Armillaria ostoyae]